MVWGLFKPDSVSEAYKKMKAEELKGKQHKLDVDKDGKIEGEDLAKLRTKKEEVENVEEGWDDMVKYVKDKNGPQPNGGAGKKQGSRYGGSKQKDDEKPVKEEAEQIDEISKKTLGSYVNKASVDMANKTSDATGKRTMAGADYAHNISTGMSAQKAKDHLKKDTDAAKPDVDKAVKRMHGINKAVQRLTKEDVTEAELDEMIAEVLKASDDAGKWISDFTKSDNPKFAGKSPEKRKQMALAAYYAAQKKESTDYDSFIELDEEADLVKTGAKEIKHANIKDKEDDKDDFGPRAQGEKDFLDQLSVNVTDDPARDGHKTGADRVKPAAKPVAQGPGKYDGSNKTGIKKESAGEEDCSCDDDEKSDTKEEARSSKAKGKKTFSSFKEEMKSKKGC